MDYPLFQILSLPDDVEKSLTPQSQKYVWDTKAMVSTAVDVQDTQDHSKSDFLTHALSTVMWFELLLSLFV